MTCEQCQQKDMEIARLLKIINDNLERSADGVLLCMHDGPLYCPKCGDKVKQEHDLCYCWSCPNPDDYGEIPLPLFYSMVLAIAPERKEVMP